jgi:hypothetical protein
VRLSATLEAPGTGSIAYDPLRNAVAMAAVPSG